MKPPHPSLASQVLGVVFVALSAAGAYLLWNVALPNGIGEFTRKACAPGGSVTTEYTGVLPEVDKFLCVLVAFFEAALSYPVGRPFILFFANVFAAPLLIISLESLRPANPLIVRISPLITGLFCQAMGAAIVLPIWFALYSIWQKNVPSAGSDDARKSRVLALMPAFLVAYFFTGWLMFDPLHLFSRGTSHLLSATWQAFPIWFAILGAGLSLVIPTPAATSLNANQQRVLTFFAALTAPLHFYSLFLLSQTSPHKSFLTALASVVQLPLHPTTLPAQTHLFLLFDALIVTTSTFLFVVFAPGRALDGKRLETAAGVVGLSLLVGPGAAFLWAWSKRLTGEAGDEKRGKEV